MSAKYDSFRSILDQLMGGDRDLLPEHKTNRQMHFSDDKVCKFYICGLCPHELFTNTKSDLGPCAHLHDDDVKAQYDQLPYGEKLSKYPYERDFIARMQKMIADLDKRIDRGHQRLSLQDHENPLTPDKMEKLDAISEQIELLLRQMEELGAAGRLQEAQNLELQIFKLKAEQEATKKGGAGPASAALAVQQQDKRLKVCEICGAFLVVGDTDDRIKSHNDGKQHQGYSAIRTILDEKRKNALSAGLAPVSRAILRDNRSDRATAGGGGRDTRDRDRRGDFEPSRGGGGRFAQGDSAPRSIESYYHHSSGGRRDYDRDDRERAYSASRRDHHHHHSRDRERDRDRGRDRDRRPRRERSPPEGEEEDDKEAPPRKREREEERELPRPTDKPAPVGDDEGDPHPHHPEPKRRRALNGSE